VFASGIFGAPGPEGHSVGSKPQFGRSLSRALVLGLGLSLGACSTMSDMGEATTEGVSKVADAMNPFNWFGDSKKDDANGDAARENGDAAREDGAVARAKQQRAVANTATKTGVKSAARDDLAQRNTEQDEVRYPKLSAVPDRPREATSKKAAEARKELREGLIADTAHAQYTDNELRAQTNGLAGTRQTDSARSNERLAGEPPAVPAPTMPVASAPVASAPVGTTPQRVAAATPRIVPPTVAAQTARPASYGARQAAAASAAPMAPAAPSAPTPQPAPQRQAALAASQPAPAPAASEPRTVRKTVQVATIYFNSGSARLSPNDRRIVQQVSDVARRTGGTLRIIGHSSMAHAGRDAERAAMVNYKMSLERADAVAKALLSDGIPGNQMQVMAEGSQNPIYAESSATGVAGNRRTEIYLDFYENR
jgi:outer membrane protein OmpA-like peptidoglycan-associated protein